MDEATLAQAILTVVILLTFVGFLIWAIRSGQFKNVEEAKYRMLSDLKTKNGDNEESPGNTAKRGDEKK